MIVMSEVAASDGSTDKGPIREKHVLFEQNRTDFEPNEGCYLAQSKARKVRIKPLTLHTLNLDRDCDMSEYLYVSWKREIFSSNSRWSLNLINTIVDVPGTIDVRIPAIFTNSAQTCKEISTLLDNWIEDITPSNNDKMIVKKMLISVFTLTLRFISYPSV